MKTKKMMKRLGIFCVCVSVLLTACSSKSDEGLNSDNTTGESEGDTADIEKFDITVDYKEKQLNTAYDESAASKIQLSDSGIQTSDSSVTVEGNSVTITKAGTYIISGSVSDGQVIVDSTEEGYVWLVLNNASITSQDSPGIYVKSADNTLITLPEGTKNEVTDGKEYTSEEGDTELNAAIYSKDDLFINGTGSLTVNGNYNHGIQSKDDLVIISGNITVHSAGDGIVGKDSVVVKEAEITIEAGGDGLKSTNLTQDKGYIYLDAPKLTIEAGNDGIQAETCMVIHDGSYNIIAGDDGIHSEIALDINGGNIEITKSYEGIESANISVNGGTITLISTDDGFNAAGGSGSSQTHGRPGQDMFAGAGDYELTINGGTIQVCAEGDGLDSNGKIVINGGEVYVDGPTSGGNSALDYETTMEINGGIVMAVGSIGMAEAPTGGTQNSVMINLESVCQKGTEFKIQDESGSTILSCTPEKAYQSIVFSAPQLKKGETYSLIIDGEVCNTVTLEDTVTTSGISGGMRGGMPGGMGGGVPGDKKGGMKGGMRGEIEGGTEGETAEPEDRGL